MSEDGIVDIRGKKYHTVAKRVRDFRQYQHHDYAIETEVLSAAELVLVRAAIKDSTGRIISTGLAEEERGSTNINSTSAVENAETSAVGRALAFLGYGGTEIASADEMENALQAQEHVTALNRVKAHMDVLREHTLSVATIKEALLNDDYSRAQEAWQELMSYLTDEETSALWLAPTKGGIWTTKEREQMKSTEWREARG